MDSNLEKDIELQAAAEPAPSRSATLHNDVAAQPLFISPEKSPASLNNDRPGQSEAAPDHLSTTQSHSLHLVQSTVEVPKNILHETAFIFIICCAQLLTQASLGQVILPLHMIGSSFGTVNPAQLSWYIAAYSLTVGTFILIAGRLGDLFGHKALFTGGFLWLALWSLVAGFGVYVKSGSIFFDCCRALQGIGPAFLLPNAIAILGRAYPPGRRQEMVFSIFGACAPFGFVVGAIFSSLFAQLLWWPWAFWVAGIACVLLAAAGHFIIPHTPAPRIDSSENISMWTRVDALGATAGVIGLVLVNFAWNQGPTVGWSTPYTYVLLIVGFLFLTLFAFFESRAQCPLLPLDVLSSDTAFVLGCVAAGWSSFGIWVYYTVQFMSQLRNESPLLVTAHFIPVALSGPCAAVTTGFILHRTPPAIVMLMAMLAFMVGALLIATAPVGQIYWAQTFVAMLVTPWGMDMSFPAATILLSNRMKKEHQGVAASLVNTVVNYSISIGLGFAGTIEGHVNDGGQNILKGYRGALYMGIGLSGIGVVIAMAFYLSHLRSRRKAA